MKRLKIIDMIDEDRQILVSILSEIKETGNFKFRKMINNKEPSLFQDEMYVSNISEYFFDSPIELRQQLARFWNQLGHGELDKLSDVLTVMAFKAKDKEPVVESVSPYIYEM